MKHLLAVTVCVMAVQSLAWGADDAMSWRLSTDDTAMVVYDSSFAFPPAVLMDYTYENFYDTVSDAPEPYLWRSSMMNQGKLTRPTARRGRRNSVPR